MKNLLSLILVVSLTIGASDLLACKYNNMLGGAKKNTSASVDKTDDTQLVVIQPAIPAPGNENLYVEANVIAVNKNGVKQYRCPVSGIENSVAADTRYIDYESKRYYLNCPGSMAKFEANPTKYVFAMNGKTKISHECTPDQCDHAAGYGCGYQGAKGAKVKNPQKSS